MRRIPGYCLWLEIACALGALTVGINTHASEKLPKVQTILTSSDEVYEFLKERGADEEVIVLFRNLERFADDPDKVGLQLEEVSITAMVHTDPLRFQAQRAQRRPFSGYAEYLQQEHNFPSDEVNRGLIDLYSAEVSERLIELLNVDIQSGQIDYACEDLNLWLDNFGMVQRIPWEKRPDDSVTPFLGINFTDKIPELLAALPRLNPFSEEENQLMQNKLRRIRRDYQNQADDIRAFLNRHINNRRARNYAAFCLFKLESMHRNIRQLEEYFSEN